MYKDLNLNRMKLISSIEKFCKINFNNYEVAKAFQELGTTRKRVSIKADGKNFYMDFHFKTTNGSTSIDLSGGSEGELREEIAKFILNDSECIIGDKDSKSKWFVAKGINYEDFKVIIELLQKSEFCKELCSSSQTKISDLFKFKGQYNESLSVFYYHSNNKVMIQGRPLLLFNEALVFITELLEFDELPKAFNDYYEVKIEKDDIQELYQHFLPNSYSIHTQKLKKVLLQAVYNYSLEGDMFDYGFLAFPALKALEGHLKLLLKNWGIPVSDTSINIFGYDKTTKLYFLPQSHRTTIGDAVKVNYVEDAYNYYNSKRHGLFHWADPTAPLDQTVVIENLGIARQLIIDTLKKIDEYYIL